MSHVFKILGRQESQIDFSATLMIGYLGCTKHSTNDKFMQDLDICFDVETLKMNEC